MQEDGEFGFCSSQLPFPKGTSEKTQGSSQFPSSVVAPSGELSNGIIQLILSKVDTKLKMLEREVVELASKNVSLEERVSSLISKNVALEEQVLSVLAYTSSAHEKLTHLERQGGVGSLPAPVVTPEREGFYASFSVSPSSSRSLFHSPDKADTGVCTPPATASPTTTATSCPPKIVYSLTDLHQIRSKYVDGPVSKRRIPSPLLMDAIKTKESYKVRAGSCSSL